MTRPSDDDLEIPDFLRRSRDEVPAPIDWTSMRSNIELVQAQTRLPDQDETTDAILAEIAEAKRIRSHNRIARMKARFEAEAAKRAGKVWDAQRGGYRFPNHHRKNGATTMIAIQPRTFTRRADAARAAAAHLAGAPFVTEQAADGRYIYRAATKQEAPVRAVEKKPPSGKNGRPAKMADGPTGIERQAMAAAAKPKRIAALDIASKTTGVSVGTALKPRKPLAETLRVEDVEAAIAAKRAAPKVKPKGTAKPASKPKVKPAGKTKMSAPAKPASAPKASGAPASGKRAAILAAAQAGKLPEPPDFSAETHKPYRGKLAEVVALVKAKDIAGLKGYAINPRSTSPKAIDRYRNHAVIALEAQAAK